MEILPDALCFIRPTLYYEELLFDALRLTNKMDEGTSYETIFRHVYPILGIHSVYLSHTGEFR